ncbi:MAG: hypothetical protein ACJ8F7_11480 [Gemmataceae bacterium]
MLRMNWQMLAVAACLTVMSSADRATAQQQAPDAKSLEGLWSGAWGGGERNGAVFQPVIAELMIQGDRVEGAGLRTVDRIVGTLRLDPQGKRMRVTPDAAAGQPAPKAVEYSYVLKGDLLTLTDGDNVQMGFSRQRIAQDPPANVHVDLVTAAGFNDAGDLLVTEFSVLKAGKAGVIYHRPDDRTRYTKGATVFLVQDAGLKKVTLEEARKLLRPATPVAVAYRADDQPAPAQFNKLWENTGSPPPDGQAVAQTLVRILRPGTLVFILSARENAPRP